MKKRLITIFITLVFVTGLFPSYPVLTYASEVSTLDGLKSAISAALTDGTETVIKMTGSIDVNETIELPQNVNIVFEGSSGAGLSANCSGAIFKLTGNSTVSIKNLNIKNTASDGNIFAGKTSDVSKIYGTSEVSSQSYILNGNGRGQKTSLYIYGGVISTPSTIASGNLHHVIFTPTADISFSGKAYKYNNSNAANPNAGTMLIAQSGYTITSAEGTGKLAGVTAELLNAATEESPYGWPADSDLVVSTLKITVSGGTPVVSGDIEGGVKTVSKDSTEFDIVWGYGGSVTEKDGKYVITPAEGYAIDKIYVDDKLYEPSDSEAKYEGVSEEYTYVGNEPRRHMSVYFEYTITVSYPG